MSGESWPRGSAERAMGLDEHGYMPSAGERVAFRRATVTLRPGSTVAREASGWASHVHGVPVVLCRDERGVWQCVEPTRGLPIRRLGPDRNTREDALAVTRRRVELCARRDGKEPGDWLRELIAGWGS